MDHKTGCLVCGNNLVYTESANCSACYYCGTEHETNAACKKGHYICDTCHNASANDLIEKYCIHTASTDPIEQAILLMKNPALKMHGPEHHFLIPAVLLASYYNRNQSPVEEKAESIRTARQRADEIKGGFCGFQGACGAAIGTGIFISVLTKSTPYSKAEWRLSNLMTAQSLVKIAENEGPRCCKRGSFQAILTAVDFLKRNFKIALPVDSEPGCSFGSLNMECHREKCRFFPG